MFNEEVQEVAWMNLDQATRLGNQVSPRALEVVRSVLNIVVPLGQKEIN
jgi:hypothetical protein